MAWFTQLFIFCLLATATMGSTDTSPSTIGTNTPPETTTGTPGSIETSPEISASTPGPTETPPEMSASTSGATETPPEMSASTSGPTETPPEMSASTPGPTETPPEMRTSPAEPTETPPDVSTSTPEPTETPPEMSTSTPGPTETPPEISTSTPGPTEAPPAHSTSTPGMTEAPPAPSTSAPGTTEAPPEPTTSSPRPDHCASSPCPRDSTCERLYDSFTCVCRPGLFYNDQLNTCSLVKTFPIELRINMTFVDEMLVKSSDVFTETSQEIITVLNETFKNQPGYIGSTVLSLARGSVIADVDSAFSIESDVNKTTVENILKNAAIESELLIEPVNVKDTCSRGYCEERTTTCEAQDGLSICSCKEGYIKIDATEQACMACPSGEEAVDSTTCEPCAFGYSGFNCNEPYLLIVVIVSCVLGTLFLATLVAVIVVSSRRPKQSIVSSEDSGAFSEFSKPSRIPRIPRANPDSGWQPANLETADSGSSRALVTKDRPESIAMDNYSDAYNGYTRSQRNQTPSRTGYGNGNGYQARGVNNGSRGTRNPYYDDYDRDDDGFGRY